MTNEVKKSITKNDVESVLKYGRVIDVDSEIPDAKDGEDTSIDLFKTNANKLRSILGRGSLATIQKHLTALRTAARAAEAPAEESAKHIPDADAVQAIWSVVVKTACSDLLMKISTLSDIHDRDRTIIAEQSESIEELRTECLSLEEKVEGATREMTVAVVKSERQAITHQTALEEVAARLSEAHKQNKILTDIIEKALGETNQITNGQQKQQKSASIS